MGRGCGRDREGGSDRIQRWEPKRFPKGTEGRRKDEGGGREGKVASSFVFAS